MHGSAEVGFRYVVEVNKTKDAGGRPVPEAKRDLRRAVSKRNTLTAKNLKNNSTYQVRYSIEITKKQRGEPVKVVRRTALSPFSSVVVPQR